MFKKILLTLLVLTLLPVSAFADDERGFIESSYKVSKEFAPEVATVVFVVETKDKSPKVAADKNKGISSAVLKILKSKINPAAGDKVVSKGYTVSPRYIYTNKKRKLDAYSAYHRIQVKTSSVDGLGAFIDAALSAGATEASNISFSLKNESKNCRKLVSEASKNAKADAEAIAISIGEKLRGVKSVHYSCSSNDYYRPMYAKAGAMMESSAQNEPTKIEASSIKINANVRVQFFVMAK